MARSLAHALQERIDKKKGDRTTYENHWQDIAWYTYPGQEFLTEHHPGEKRNTRIFDTTALQANEQLAGSLHALLTSPSTRWFALTVQNMDAPLGYRERRWLDDTSEKMYALFNSERSGFNSAVHEMYMSLGAFGNGCLYQEYSPRMGTIRFQSYSLNDCFIGEDNDGVVNTFYRRIPGTAAVMAQKLGARTPKKMRELAEKDPFAKVEIWHCVEPRGLYSMHPQGDLPFMSAYLYPDTTELISTGGYASFPYQFPRFSKRSGESYGFGPGGTAYPDVKMLQRIKEVMIRGAEKQVDPPILVPNDSVIGPLVINPGGRINYNATAMGDGGIRPLEMNSRPQLADKILEDVQQTVREAFYVEWMQLPQRGPQMTATEVLQRRDESLRLLSPMLSRMNSEFTGPLIDRTFQLMLRHGMIEEPPESLRGQDMKIEYLSPIAQAQRMTDLESINRSLALAMGLAELDPMVMQNFDLDAIVQGASADINKIPARYMRPPQAVQGARQQAAQAAQQAQQMAVQESQANAAKASTQASKNAAQAGAI